MVKNFMLIVFFVTMKVLIMRAQTVSNVYATQEGMEIIVSYSLSYFSPCEISLFLSSDNGMTWEGPLSDCTGDIGKNVSSGDKLIRWNVLTSREQLVGRAFQFKIRANGRKEFEPEMVFVEGSSFIMGSTSGENDELPLHTVHLSSFSIGKYEVTQAQWKTIMGNDPSYFFDCDQCPVERVSWEDVQLYINKLNQLTGKTYRLPTEAEWEYAAQGGKESKRFIFSGSNKIEEFAFYVSNSGAKSHEVGGNKANELGIHDMTGNVWEWCYDWFEMYGQSSQKNPTGPAKGFYRVIRGGGWSSTVSQCRLANRDMVNPGYKGYDCGFRLVLP